MQSPILALTPKTQGTRRQRNKLPRQPGEKEARNKMIRETRKNKKKGIRLKPPIPNFSL